MAYNISELSTHVNTLCATHSITITERVSGGGRSFAKQRMIHVKPVKSLITYFVSMHEIGHIVHPRGAGTAVLRLEKEYNAWDWALQNALLDPNAATKKMIHRCLTSYTKKVKRHAKMKTLPLTHPLWDMIREMEKG